MTRAGIGIAVALVVTCAPMGAQEAEGPRQAYFRAVATYFELSPTEITILGDWDMPADEIPVVLFVASRAGVSPEALVALRDAGESWVALAARYRINASTLHVPLAGQAQAGPLSVAYEMFRSTPVREWGSIRLSDRDIIALVNVRVLAQVVDMSPEDVLARAAVAPTFVALYGDLIN